MKFLVLLAFAVVFLTVFTRADDDEEEEEDEDGDGEWNAQFIRFLLAITSNHRSVTDVFGDAIDWQ